MVQGLGMKKQMKEFFENKSTQEFIEELKIEENLHTPPEGYVKSRASRGQNAGTWMHPISLYRINCYYQEPGRLNYQYHHPWLNQYV